MIFLIKKYQKTTFYKTRLYKKDIGLFYKKDMADDDYDYISTISRCCEEDDVQGLKEYVQSGGDMYAEDIAGNRLIYTVIFYNSVKCLDFLLRTRPELLRKNGNNTTLLEVASSRDESFESLKMLLKYGADPNEICDDYSYYGRTPLLTSIQHQSWKCFEYLAEYPDTDLNITDRCGDTPLHIAARYNPPEYIKKLLDRGANPSIKNKSGMTFLDHIRVQDRDLWKEIIEYIKDVEEINKWGCIKEPYDPKCEE